MFSVQFQSPGNSGEYDLGVQKSAGLVRIVLYRALEKTCTVTNGETMTLRRRIYTNDPWANAQSIYIHSQGVNRLHPTALKFSRFRYKGQKLKRSFDLPISPDRHCKNKE